MLTREQILTALSALNERLRTRDVHGELGLLGGAVMLLVFQARASTRDVDAIFSPSSEIRAAVAEVAEELDRDDIATLCSRLGIRDADHVMEIVLRYYPPARVSPRAVFLVREILASIPNEDRST